MTPTWATTATASADPPPPQPTVATSAAQVEEPRVATVTATWTADPSNYYSIVIRDPDRQLTLGTCGSAAGSCRAHDGGWLMAHETLTRRYAVEVRGPSGVVSSEIVSVDVVPHAWHLELNGPTSPVEEPHNASLVASWRDDDDWYAPYLVRVIDDEAHQTMRTCSVGWAFGVQSCAATTGG